VEFSDIVPAPPTDIDYLSDTGMELIFYSSIGCLTTVLILEGSGFLTIVATG
jgi:hypothetical protein